MTRTVALIGAPSNIGIRPYDDGTPRGLDQAPAVLRETGLVAAIQAAGLDIVDDGDVTPGPYRDFTRVPDRPRNEPEMLRYIDAIGTCIATIVRRGDFPLLIGGDCSIVLGGLLGVRRAGKRRVGLVYLDGHADFATPQESRSGSVASMCLALAVGRGETPLARLGGDEPLVRDTSTALVGRRDEAEPWYGHAALHASAILDLSHAAVKDRGYVAMAEPILECVAAPPLDGFWIHVDADVLPADIMSAVDSPQDGGPGLEELAQLLSILVRHPKSLGMELTIYDPRLDADRACAERLVTLVRRSLG